MCRSNIEDPNSLIERQRAKYVLGLPTYRSFRRRNRVSRTPNLRRPSRLTDRDYNTARAAIPSKVLAIAASASAMFARPYPIRNRSAGVGPKSDR
jgi:hypothetical protein